MAIDTREISGKHLNPLLPDAGDNAVGTMKRVEAPPMDDIVETLQKLGVVSFQLDEKNEPSISVDLDMINEAEPEEQKALYTQLAQKNLVPPSAKDPEQRIQLLRHGMGIAIFPEMAGADILAHTLPENNLTPLQIMKTQASLNRLGYDVGNIDGAFGRKSANAIADFLDEYPNESNYASGTVINSLGRYLPKEKMDILFEGNEAYKTNKAEPDNLPRRTAQGYVLMNPEMLRAMETNDDIRRYVNIAQSAALDPKHGRGVLDPNMFANQLWQESLKLIHAKPSRGTGITSDAGAVGIGQFLPSTGARYGLDTAEKLADPVLSIQAAARHMRDLTEKHGDQRLALVAYNGGDGAVSWIAKKYPDGHKLKYEEWEQHATAEHDRHGPPKTRKERGLWRNETRNYPREIVSDHWAASRVQRALSMEANQKQMYKPEENAPEKKRNIEERNATVQQADAGPATDHLATPEGYEAHLQRLKQSEISFEASAQPRLNDISEAKGIHSQFQTAAARQPENTTPDLDAKLDPRKLPGASLPVSALA